MARVSVPGLGGDGDTLARVLLERSHEVTVWAQEDGDGGEDIAAVFKRMRAARP